jgi:hypothetical protein
MSTSTPQERSYSAEVLWIRERGDWGCGANRARNQVPETQEQSSAGVQTYQYPLYHRGGLLEAMLEGRQANDNEIDSDEA